MTKILCRVVPEPHHEHTAVFRQTSVALPYFDGDNYEVLTSTTSYLCGNCEFVLAKNIQFDQIYQLLNNDQLESGIVLQCPRCQKFNQLDTKMD